MQINLKQQEIIQAIKGYIVSQGINLQGKEVTISFTAGRKESGISAEVSIEDKEDYVAPEPVAKAVAAPVAHPPVTAEKRAYVEELIEEEPTKNNTTDLGLDGEQPHTAIKTVSLFS